MTIIRGLSDLKSADYFPAGTIEKPRYDTHYPLEYTWVGDFCLTFETPKSGEPSPSDCEEWFSFYLHNSVYHNFHGADYLDSTIHTVSPYGSIGFDLLPGTYVYDLVANNAVVAVKAGTHNIVIPRWIPSLIALKGLEVCRDQLADPEAADRELSRFSPHVKFMLRGKYPKAKQLLDKLDFGVLLDWWERINMEDVCRS